MRVLAIFGPTAVGKTAVAIATAELLRERGEDPVAVTCDAIQVYRGLETLSGAATPAERTRLEHRLLGFVDVDGGVQRRPLRHAWPTPRSTSCWPRGAARSSSAAPGLYLRAALADLDLRPPVPAGVRAEVEREIAERGSEALHAELDPDVAATVHPSDRKRIARLHRAAARRHRSATGERAAVDRRAAPPDPAGRPDGRPRASLTRRIDARVEEMVAAGRRRGGACRRLTRGASRTARAALGFEELLAGDVEAVKRAHRAYARRQLTWMRKMPGVELIDRTGRADAEVAAEIVAGARLMDLGDTCAVAESMNPPGQAGAGVSGSSSPLDPSRVAPPEVREVAGAGQRLRDRRARRAALGADAERVRRLCEPHFGVGSDGILLLSPAERPAPRRRAADLQPRRLRGRALGQRRPAGGALPAARRLDRRGRVHDPHQGRARFAPTITGAGHGDDGDGQGLGDLRRLSLRAAPTARGR